EALNVFLGEAYTRKMDNVVVKQTGCMGLCYAEPTVEVKMEGMPDTLYGNVDAAVARKIVNLHLLGGKLVNDHVFDYPARDINKE
ncbi:MAG: (2Fe-2S) ferredoxin domain-containing protein, partial [Spirochaetes bacterium]